MRSIGAAYVKLSTTVSLALVSTLLRASQINPAPPIFFDASKLAFTAAELTGEPS